jgi:putative hemolysin
MADPMLGGTSRSGEYSLSLAEGDEIAEAQRLRHDTFAAEFGAQLSTLANGLDADEFDEHCDHLIVRHNQSDAIVGTYRMMTPQCAELVGGRFGDHTFDLSPLASLDAELVETGRSCVHPDHRQGAVISLLWNGIGSYMRRSGYKHLAGCAWIPMDDGGQLAAGIWAAVRDKYLAPDEYRITPRRPLFDGNAADSDIEPARLPPLLRGYLRSGGWICAEPAYDPEMGVAAFYVLLSMDQISPRFRRHFYAEED